MRLTDTPHAFWPFEVPSAGKVYVLGGEPNGVVTIDVIETTGHTWQKRITFDEPDLRGVSAGPYAPFAYDSETHTLFVGASLVILAIDTRTDTIKQVIPLSDVAVAIGVGPERLTYGNAVGLVYSPREHYLYSAHLDGAFLSIYDVANRRFLPQVIPVQGSSPTFLLANPDVSRLYTLNDLWDSITVIDTATKSVEKVIDVRDYVPVTAPGAPYVTLQPGSLTVAAGTTATLTSKGYSPRVRIPEPAVQWQVSVNSGSTWDVIAGATSTSYSLTPTTAEDGRRYRAVFSNPSGTATSDAATLTVQGGPLPPTFVDDPLQRGSTPITSMHVVQLRHRIDELRSRAGLGAMSWTDDPIVPGTTTIKAVHLTEMRAALAAVYAAENRQAPVFTDATLTAGATPISAVHIAELRAAVLAIW